MNINFEILSPDSRQVGMHVIQHNSRRFTVGRLLGNSFDLLSLRLLSRILVLLQWGLMELSWRPQVGGQKSVRVHQAGVCSLQRVSLGLGLASGGCVAVLDTRKLQHLLRNTGSH